MVQIEAIARIGNIKVEKDHKTILRVNHLEIKGGEVLGIIGPNGAGKSTLLKTIGLLERDARGEIELFGEEVSSRRVLRLRRRLSFVFQEPLLLDGSVFSNVSLGLRYRRLPAKEVRERVERWLRLFGISHLAQRHVRDLSGGEAQRVSLARAFATSPDIVFLDEPFSSLDPPTRARLTEDLSRILKETRVTAFLVSHDLSELSYLVDRVLLLINGEILQDGSPREVLFHPASLEAARFVGMDNLWPVREISRNGSSAVVRLDGLSLEVSRFPKTGSSFFLGVRPESLQLLPASTPALDGGKGWFRGTVRGFSVKGAFVEYRVELDAGLNLVVREPALLGARRQMVDPGAKVVAGLSPQEAHLIPAGEVACSGLR